LGFWTDKRTKYHTSSVLTPLLTGVPLLTDDNTELEYSLQILEHYLVKNFGYTPPIKAETTTIDATFEEIPPSVLVLT
jgi:hypothetical protein